MDSSWTEFFANQAPALTILGMVFILLMRGVLRIGSAEDAKTAIMAERFNDMEGDRNFWRDTALGMTPVMDRQSELTARALSLAERRREARTELSDE